MKTLTPISSVFGLKLTFTISPEDGLFFKLLEKCKLKSVNSSTQLYFIFPKKEIAIEHLPDYLFEYLKKRLQGQSPNNSKLSFIENRKLW